MEAALFLQSFEIQQNGRLSDKGRSKHGGLSDSSD